MWLLLMSNTFSTGNTFSSRCLRLISLLFRGRQSVRIQSAPSWNFLQVWLPILQIILRIIQNLTGFVSIWVWVSLVTGNDWGIIEEVEETTTVACKHDLLLGALNG
jgi:hypothetical protein